MTTIPQSPPPPPKRGWVKWVVLGCVGALVIIAVTFGAIFYGVTKATAGPEKAVRAFLAAAAAGDHAAAHGYFSEPLKQVQPYEDFVSAVRASPQFFDIASTNFSNRSVDQNGAQLSGKVTLKSGTEVPASFQLVRENDQWKLISYNIGSE